MTEEVYSLEKTKRAVLVQTKLSALQTDLDANRQLLENLRIEVRVGHFMSCIFQCVHAKLVCCCVCVAVQEEEYCGGAQPVELWNRIDEAQTAVAELEESVADYTILLLVANGWCTPRP